MSVNKPKELKRGATAQRDFTIDTRAGLDEEARTVELAFSSESPYERWWGTEILDHKASSIRLDRLKQGGALLMDHDSRDHIGVIESVQIGKDRVGRAVVRFGRGARASEVFQDVVDGIRRNVSVGYRIHEAVLESEKDGAGTYRVTDWEPYEISLVSVPADTAVGVGRESDAQDEQNQKPAPIKEARAMDEKKTPVEIDQTAIDEARRSGSDAERKRVADIVGIADQYKNYDLAGLANEAVRSGMSVDEFKGKAMEKMASAPKPTAEIGLTDKEKREYSVLRILNSLANPTDQRAREAAAYEYEVARAAADKQGREVKGIIVPFDVLTHKRDLVAGTPTAGGNLVATELLSGSFIDLLRNAMVLDTLGVDFLTGLVGNIALPRQTGGATGYWVAENGAPTASQQAFDQVSMSPKTAAARTAISRRLLIQSSVDVENLVRRDLAKVLGLTLQAAAIQGGGTNEPTGILGTAGIGDVAGGANGVAPTWDHIVDLETAVSVANADVGTLAYLTNAKVRGKLKKTFVDGPGAGERVWDRGSTPLNGYRAAVTNAVPSNLDKGTSTDVCSAIIFGNFADLIIGMWGGLELQVDPYSSGDSGSVIVRAFQDTDVGVRHPESFSAMLDALTA